MSSIAVEEEALKATLLSQVRVIHSEKYRGGSVFDVVSSDVPGDKNQFTAYVVVYPPTALFKTVENASPVWSPVMTAGSGISVLQAYEKLLADLRKDMKDVMAQARAIYGPKYPHGSTFDVIYSSKISTGKNLVVWLIVYPMPDIAAFKTGKAVSNEWAPVLKSRRIDEKGTGSTLQRGYQDLLGELRNMMVETMASMGK
ncbi:hypothetical protein J4E81_005915 [Alternaria sp. BMP 2799]|nr:hypothetical protein J4E81_005915 [Alternaria sp. BMP 2799]